MDRNMIKTIACRSFALVALLCAARTGRAAEPKNSYPTSMAPLDQYLMDRDDEIALARSAAPPSIAKDATVMVLGRYGYETAVEGTNGFVCNVDRSWMDQFENSPEFWNPERRGPVCYNPQAARTVLPITLIRTKLALAGKSKAEMNDGMKAAIEKGELPALEPGGMAYMLSKQGFLNSICGNCAPHLMFYVPVKDAHTWGAGALGTDVPVLFSPHFNGAPEPVTEFIVPVTEWSDGTPAAQDTPQEPKKEVHLVTASTPRERQIELSLSAAPTEVSSKATVYVLGANGYEKVREGTNGFSCLIERSFAGTTQTSSAPACFDAEGSRTLMLTYLRKEELRAQGKSEAEINDDIAKGFQDGRFKVPGPGFLYMMSNENYVYDSQSKKSGFVPPHLMFYAPYKTAKDLGYESISPTMVPYLTYPGPEGLMVVAAQKPSQDSSSGDSHKH